MYTKLAVTLGCAAVAAILFLSNATAAEDRDMTVGIRVSGAGLDLDRPTDARTFYSRLQKAAWITCTRGNRAGLAPVDNVQRCVEETLGKAVRSAHAPAITQIYLATHTLQQAATWGIRMPLANTGAP